MRLGRKLGFRVPEWYPIPRKSESRVYVVEEIEGTAVSLDSKDGLAAVADRLVALELATRGSIHRPQNPTGFTAVTAISTGRTFEVRLTASI